MLTSIQELFDFQRRYSHCAGVFDDQLVITHGYFYNTEVKGPQWLSDAWTMSLHSPYAMHEIHSECCYRVASVIALFCTGCHQVANVSPLL